MDTLSSIALKIIEEFNPSLFRQQVIVKSSENKINYYKTQLAHLEAVKQNCLNDDSNPDIIQFKTALQCIHDSTVSTIKGLQNHQKIPGTYNNNFKKLKQ